MQHDPVEQVFEYLADGQHGAALGELDRLIREEPYHGLWFALRALVHADSGHIEQALEDARAGREVAPDHPFVHYVSGAIALHQGEVISAIQSAQRAQQLDPTYADAILLEARARAMAGQWPRVAELAERISQREPDNEEAAVLATIARGVVRDGVLDEAAWTSVVERFPLNPVARTGSGWTHLTRGRINAAQAQFEQALALDPSLTWAKEGLVLALKARNPAYALLLRFFLWFGRLPQHTRTLLLVGGVLGYNFLRRTAGANPEAKPLITPILIAYVGFVLLSWLADPLLNLLLMARPEGRRLLNADERRSATLVAGCLGTALILAAFAMFTEWTNAGLGAFGVGFTTLAIAAAYQRQGTRRVQLQTLAAFSFGASLAATVTAAPLSGLLLGLAILCVVVGTWMS
ncbi:MAG TPA: tetratricopeptide repeat protein, partial [Gemmatimonadales bacterium]|nr:tetratricopeptide repeat protein [Gemmatimonadales bacterium]